MLEDTGLQPIYDAEHLNRLRIWRDGVAATPKPKFNMGYFKGHDRDCGTTYCAAGIAATLPEFAEKGLSWQGPRIINDEIGDRWGVATSVHVGSFLGLSAVEANGIFYGGYWDDKDLSLYDITREMVAAKIDELIADREQRLKAG